MTTAYTSLLGLALPVTGELSGTWGDTVNTAITSLLDTAVAGTTSITTDADITLTTTTGASNQARQAIILWNPASGTTTRYITAPAQSKLYTVINASGGTQSVVIRGAGPTTGVTIAKGESAMVAWNGSDFVKVSSSGGAITFTDLTVTGNTILGDAAADTLTVNATSTFASPVNFQGLVKLPSTGRSAAAALTVTAPAFLYGVASTYTDTTSSGTIGAMAPFYSIAQPTLSTSNVTTYTNAATLYIANAPAAGGSATITNPYALYIAAGANYLGGTLGVSGLATFSADNTAAIFQGATQGNINIQKTGTSGFGMYSDAAGVLAFYNNNNSRNEARFNSTGLIVGPNIGTEVAAAPLNVYNGNANGELLRLEGLGSRTGWNGFKFITSSVGNRHTVFDQSGVVLQLTPYETNTGSAATDGQFSLNFNTVNFLNYDTTTRIGQFTTSGLGIGGTVNTISGAKNVSVGSYANFYSLNSGYGGVEQNGYNDGTWRFNTNNYATMYQQYVGDGSHYWYSSSAAAAGGTAITWTQLMKLNRTSQLLIGAGNNFGAQALTTPGINIGSDANGTSMSITNADGISSATDARLLFGNGSSTYGALRMVFNSTSNVSIDAVQYGSTGTPKDLLINANGGSVGVTNSLPSTYGKLVVGSGTIALVTDTSSQRRLSFWSTANGNSENAFIQVQNDGATTNTGEMLFGTRNASGTLAERGRFTAPGVFQVGSIETTNNAVGTFSASKFLLQTEDTTTTRSYACGPDTSTYARWEHYTAKSNGTPLLTQRWNASANIEVRNIGLGLVTATTSGTGITFPATQAASSDANTLDDYEEGTWTPIYQTTSNDMANFGYNSQQGRYVKVGKLVTITFTISTINAAGVTGNGGILIQGLPFPSNDVSNGVPVSVTTIDSRFTNNPFGGFIETSAPSQINLFKTQAMNSANYLTVADFTKTNTGNFNLLGGTVTYTTV